MQLKNCNQYVRKFFNVYLLKVKIWVEKKTYVEVEAALDRSGFDEDMFFKRGRQYKWTKGVSF
jgi:hypothetical protein